ncbi:MAG: esterase/lipase, partial [Frankiales bacterium]|nr:esterase/lipase [Frankiales bacterium]
MRLHFGHTGSVLLVLACVGLVAVANGLRPLRWTPLVVPSFFAAWLTVELAPQLLVLTAVVTLVLALTVGVSWLGLVVTALVAAGLAVMVRMSEAAADAADEALAGWPEPVDPADPRASGLRRFFRPMSFKHPDVVRTVDVAYGDLPRHKLDVYQPREAVTGAPTLLQVHGGAWVIGDKKEQGRPLMNHLTARGWVCFAPNYRLSPKATWPDHLV